MPRAVDSGSFAATRLAPIAAPALLLVYAQDRARIASSLDLIPTAVRPFPAIPQPCSANPFGTAFSCDGVHPSASTHRLIAQKLRLAINAAYTTSIPPIP